MPPIRRKPRNPYDKAALGVYRGPARLNEPPALTPYRRRVLEAIGRKEIHRGKGQYERAWRWSDDGIVVTASKWVDEALRCGWAKVVGAHVELTTDGQAALARAGGEG